MPRFQPEVVVHAEIRHALDAVALHTVAPGEPGRVITGTLLAHVPNTRRWRVRWSYTNRDGVGATTESEVATRNLYASSEDLLAARAGHRRRGRGGGGRGGGGRGGGVRGGGGRGGRGRGGRGRGSGGRGVRGEGSGGRGGRGEGSDGEDPAVVENDAEGDGRGEPASGASEPSAPNDVEVLGEPEEIESDVDETLDPAEAVEAQNPGRDVLCPHGQQWEDAASIRDKPQNLSTVSPHLRWGHGEGAFERTPMDYFNLLYPTEHLRQTLQLTNAYLQRDHHGLLTRQEFFQFIAMMVGVAAHPSYTIKQLFGVERPTGLIRRCPDYSEFMTYERYTAISTHLTFAEPPDLRQPGPGKGSGKGFWAIQPLIDAFNECRERVISPGSKLCADESMTKWRAVITLVLGVPVPCILKMKAKPVPVGMMTKNLACAASGVMLRLEMVTRPAESALKEFNDRVPAGTGFLLRLSRPFWGTGRHIVADAGFASTTAAAELAQKGLHFTGVVKGAHKYFPKKYLQQQEYTNRGDHHSCTTERAGIPIRALAWNEGKPDRHGRIKPKCFVSTCGTTLPGTPHLKTRYQRYTVNDDYCAAQRSQVMRTYHVPIPRPELASSYYDGCQAIDVHNHLAQTTLGLEDRKTKRYSFRYFQTFVRFVITDAFLAYKYFGRNPDAKFEAFRDALCDSLINNTIGARDGSVLRPSRRAPVADGGAASATPAALHSVEHLRNTAYYRRKTEEANGSPVTTRLHCRACKHLTVFHCVDCTQDDSRPSRISAVCAPTTRPCFITMHTETEDDASDSPPARMRARLSL